MSIGENFEHENAQIVCCECESKNVITTTEDYTFPYGLGEDAVELSVKIPVQRCQACQAAFTGHLAAEIQHNAVCAHLGLFNPAEVRAIRDSYGMSQTEFGAVTGIGKASIARWETGALLQGKAHNNLLALLTFPENMERLRARLASRTSP